MESLSSRKLVDLGKVPVRNVPSKLVDIKNLPVLLGGVIFLLVVKFVATAFYNLYFHPLRKYPGPKYAVMSGLPYIYWSTSGDLVAWIRTQHEKYGEVVRLGPDRLSYISPQAWKDIYGHRTGGKLENPKDTRFYQLDLNGETHIINTEGAGEHGRLRKIFSNAFSDRALKLQEPLIKKYVDKLIANMHSTVAKDAGAELDLVKLYNCTTFDIMGDLTFGEPLGMLEASEYTPWVAAVFGQIKTGDLSRIRLEYPWIGSLLRAVLPASLREMERLHFQHSVERVDRRLAKGVDGDKADIWKLVLEKDKGQLRLGQMHANSSLFMIAGTETTATLLSGLTFHFLRNPAKLQRAVAEVRALAEDELSLERLPQLPYLAACFEEALRCYPPVPIGVPREVAAGGNVICGEWVPGKTRVSVPQWASYRSTLNFKDPNDFVPERWLPDTGYDSDRKDVLQPFSFGPRNCLGKNLAYHEMRIIMAKVLWHFDLELCPQSDNWADQKTYSLWEKPGLWVKAKPVH
ncbi:hypothetical protein SLS56_009719 [Neofusicoccum ribis]|uniref:Cytochrome P450 monooxygenase n=1 Tax=Neofusicoccum ribis TaxID=45134 RepID=A0ABR3SGK8_9PEZI